MAVAATTRESVGPLNTSGPLRTRELHLTLHLTQSEECRRHTTVRPAQLRWAQDLVKLIDPTITTAVIILFTTSRMTSERQRCSALYGCAYPVLLEL